MKIKFGIIVLFFSIFIIGFLLRAPEVIARNYLFGFDQGRDYLAAYSIAEDHKFTLIGAEVGAGSAGLRGIFHGPGYFYLIALMLKLFNGDPYGGIVLMFTFGITAMIFTFLLGKKIFGIGGGLVAFYLVSMAPLIAPQSRFVWNHHLTSPIIVVYLWLVYLLVNPALREGRGDKFLAPFAVFVAGILYHFELAISVPLILSVFVILVLVVREKRWQVYLLCFLAAVLSYLPMILFEARHDFMALRGVISYVLGHGEHGSSFSIKILQQHVASFMANARDTFVFEFGFIRPQHYDLTIKIFLAITAVSFFLSKNKVLKRYIQSLFLMIVISFIVFLFLNNSIWNYYLIHLHFVYIFFFAFSVVTMVEKIVENAAIRTFILTRSMDSRLRGNDTYKGLTLLLCVSSLLFLSFFLLSMAKGVERRIYMNIAVDLPDYGGKEKIAGKRYIIDYIYKDAAGKPFNVFVFTPPVYTYPYDYLFKTYGKQTYGYSPGNEKKGLTYLIMEIDGTKYWSWKGWLDTVIKTGTVISHEYLAKPDLILEKRMFEE